MTKGDGLFSRSADDIKSDVQNETDQRTLTFALITVVGIILSIAGLIYLVG